MPGGAPLGNTNGAKENRLITDTLRRAATQNAEKLRKACEAVLEKAADGDLAAFTVLADRLDGKAHQSITHEGSEMTVTINAPDAKTL